MELPSPLDMLRDNTASKLPTYRHVDLQRSRNVEAGFEGEGEVEDGVSPTQPSHGAAANQAQQTGTTHIDGKNQRSSQTQADGHIRNHSSHHPSTSTPKARTPSVRRKTFPPAHDTAHGLDRSPLAEPPSRPRIPTSKPQRKPPASHSRSRNGLLKEFWSGPPPAMITQGAYKIDNSTTSTTDWVASQQQQQQSFDASPTSGNSQPPHSPSPAQPHPTSSTSGSSGSRPLITPIRGFKPSSRRSLEMAARRMSTDRDSTLRVLEGYDSSRRISNQPEQDEHNSDDSDLFLRAAREEELARQTGHADRDGDLPTRSDSRRSRIGQRSSLPPANSTTQSPTSRRRVFEREDISNASHQMEEHGSIGQALSYRPFERERAPAPLNELNKSRFYAANSRSTPTTPRAFGRGSREISPESVSYGRRPSLPDAASALPQRASYRQSNLSYSTPRTYNSSPLVSRTTDVHETVETPRAAEGTESTVSTTAPSTVWDELEDLKSRIHRLELTGKMPATSGAAISRASNERPPTATTTVTTMSTSPKRGRGNSISPIENAAEETHGQEVHPLLHSALSKSKPLLSPEIYRALEATTSDAVAIATMIGSSGQPGPMSSSQLTIAGGSSTALDRQVRRKADSLCRSLTELCLALSEGKTEQAPPATSQGIAKSTNREPEVQTSIEQDSTIRQPMSTDLVRVKSSPRALSRLEQRRSSLLASSSLPSPRYAPSDAGTPTQSSMTGRRTSLLLRSRRGGTEEPEDESDSRLRAPSRAKTEISRARNSPREYVSQEPMPDRPLSIHSALPVKKHFATSSLPTAGAAPVPPPSNLSGRRYLDRSDRPMPDRETTSVSGRLFEDRGQTKSSIGQGFGLGRAGSLKRTTRQSSNMDSSPAGQSGGY